MQAPHRRWDGLEVISVPKKPKVHDNFKTPNEKYNAEFAVENDGAKKQSGNTFAKPAQKPQR